MKVSNPIFLVFTLPAILLVSACSSNNSSKSTVQDSTTIGTTNSSSSNIGKVDDNGVTATVDVPKAPACLRKTVSVKMDTFEQCLPDELTYVQAANVLGYRGRLQTKAGNTEIWQWNDGDGKYLSIVFDNGKLKSKTQVGLHSEY